jgi:hypothetical protein
MPMTGALSAAARTATTYCVSDREIRLAAIGSGGKVEHVVDVHASPLA